MVKLENIRSSLLLLFTNVTHVLVPMNKLNNWFPFISNKTYSWAFINANTYKKFINKSIYYYEEYGHKLFRHCRIRYRHIPITWWRQVVYYNHPLSWPHSTSICSLPFTLPNPCLKSSQQWVIKRNRRFQMHIKNWKDNKIHEKNIKTPNTFMVSIHSLRKYKTIHPNRSTMRVM